MPIHLAPFLSVRNSEAALAFYKLAFAAEEIFAFHDESKGEVIAHLSLGDSSFWLSEESPEYQNYSPETLNGSTTRMIITTEDPDAVFNRAIAAGATSICPVRDESYGWRIGRLADPFGHHWEVGRPPG
ncbi:VOC family protein [Granulicella sibirica]|uniref:Glyoxalase family protein n=1 Tax=Granulicella sibirica TaxID=2479048 RepID=A0A4V1L5F4_9BACT|nr:VOC family protein [Granulicella sibirica]RXH55574.1 Glyoxalase family protein [Granulicella sibirica]